MRKILAILLLAMLHLPAGAARKLVFTPSGSPQVQFAGFYAAYVKGFYKEAGIDLEIQHIGVNASISSLDKLKKGEADIILYNPVQCVMERSWGFDIVNIMQVADSSAIWIVSNSPLKDIKDLDKKKVAKWNNLFDEVIDMSCATVGITPEWIPCQNGVNLLLAGAVDATLALTYNEVIKLENAIGEIPSDHIVRFSKQGYSIPEYGVMTTGTYWKEHPDVIDDFCRATKRGWQWVAEHRDEATDIVVRYMEENKILSSPYIQRRMLEMVLEQVVDADTGKAECRPLDKDRFDKLNWFLTQFYYISKPVNYEDMVK